MFFLTKKKLTKKLSDKIHHKVKYTLRKSYISSTIDNVSDRSNVRRAREWGTRRWEKRKNIDESLICTQNTKPQTTIEKQKRKCYVCWDLRRCGERAMTMTNNNHEVTHSPMRKRKEPLRRSPSRFELIGPSAATSHDCHTNNKGSMSSRWQVERKGWASWLT